MNIILFDDPVIKNNLLPFTYTRPVSDLRVGTLTIREKWVKTLSANYSYLTEKYLAIKYPTHYSEKNLFLNGSILPNDDLIRVIKELRENQLITFHERPIAFYGNIDSVEELNSRLFLNHYEEVKLSFEVKVINNVFDIFTQNEQANRDDFALLTAGRKSNKIEDPYTRIYNESDIFVEENVSIKSSILNAEKGPIYIGKNATICEGTIIRGATSIGDNSIINVNARIIGDTSIGPCCKVGGEISNSVIFGNSNKAHDGFLGNSVIGEWCNLGADTNTSNLKNDYKNIRIWNYNEERFADTGRQFCGLMMGDHSKCGINTMFNTGTVVGVGSNIFGSGYPRTFIPSFYQGGAQGFRTYPFNLVLDVISKVFSRRKKSLTEVDEAILKHIFEATKKYRRA